MWLLLRARDKNCTIKALKPFVYYAYVALGYVEAHLCLADTASHLLVLGCPSLQAVSRARLSKRRRCGSALHPSRCPRSSDTPPHPSLALRGRACPSQVGLAIEGGGMRGCVSAGMIAAVSTFGLMDTFDAVYGSSAGSLVGAYAIAGQVRCFMGDSMIVVTRFFFSYKAWDRPLYHVAYRCLTCAFWWACPKDG